MSPFLESISQWKPCGLLILAKIFIVLFIYLLKIFLYIYDDI